MPVDCSVNNTRAVILAFGPGAYKMLLEPNIKSNFKWLQPFVTKFSP